jgi:hypothetical protein
MMDGLVSRAAPFVQKLRKWQPVSAVQDKPAGASPAELASFVKKITAVSSVKVKSSLAVILISRFRDIRIDGRLRNRKGASLDPNKLFP